MLEVITSASFARLFSGSGKGEGGCVDPAKSYSVPASRLVGYSPFGRAWGSNPARCGSFLVLRVLVRRNAELFREAGVVLTMGQRAV